MVSRILLFSPLWFFPWIPLQGDEGSKGKASSGAGDVPLEEAVPLEKGKPRAPREEARSEHGEGPLPERSPDLLNDGGGPAELEDLQEIEGALWSEVDSVEKRLRSLKEHMKAILPGRGLGLGGPGWDLFGAKREDSTAPLAKPSVLAAEEERRYEALLKRQAEIEKRWRGLNTPNRAGVPRKEPKTAPAQKGVPGKEPSAERGKEDSKEALRSELRQVLTEMLEMRERAREREVERLRLDLESVERLLEARRSPQERQKLVESRLEEVEKTVNEKRR